MEEKKVTIEMTEKQKNKVVEMLAAEKPPEAPVVMHLKFVHCINGKAYGPGAARVPANLQGHFESAEARAYGQMLRDNVSDTTNLEILGPGRTRRLR